MQKLSFLSKARRETSSLENQSSLFKREPLWIANRNKFSGWLSLKGTLSDKIFRRMENSFHFNKKNFKFSWSQIRYLLKYNHSNEIDTVFLFLYWISSTPTSALLLVTDSTNYCEMSSPVAKRFTVLNNLLCDLSYFNFALIGQFDVSFLANSIFRILHD